jgi:hypothetical protein
MLRMFFLLHLVFFQRIEILSLSIKNKDVKNKMRYLDLYMESLSKAAFSGENFYPGLSFISFSYQSETGQSSSILPVFTKSKLTIQKALKISKQNIAWWYDAWRTLFQRVEKEKKVDLLRFHFVNILTTLKNKESIWIIPHADKPAINKFFVSVGLKLKSLYSFHATNKDPFLGKINYAIFIKKNFSSEKILDTIGEETLKKFYHILNNKDYEGDIKKDIISKIGTNSNEFLEDIASFFDSDVEQTVLNLFQSHSPFSKLAKATPEEIETHQSELAVTSHDIEAAHAEENNPEEDSSRQEVNQEQPASTTTTNTTTIKKDETPNETTPDNPSPPVDDLSKQKEEQPERVEKEETPVETEEETVSFDEIKKQEKSISSLFHISKSSSFRTEQKKKLTTLLEDKDEEKHALTNYTSDAFYTVINKFLSTSYIQQRFLNNLELDLYSKLPSGELKSKLSDEQKNGIAQYIHSAKIFNTEDLKPHFNLTKIKKNIALILNVLSEKDANFNEDALLLRGVPVSSKDSSFDTDMWLRNHSLPESSNTFGLFQRAWFLEIEGKNEEETSSILSKYYRVGKEVSSEAFLSTSLDLNTANDFSFKNGHLGHLLLIKIPSGLPALYIDSISQCSGEHEVLLLPSTKMKLISVRLRQTTDSLYSIDNLNEIYDNPRSRERFALLFILKLYLKNFQKKRSLKESQHFGTTFLVSLHHHLKIQ